MMVCRKKYQKYTTLPYFFLLICATFVTFVAYKNN